MAVLQREVIASARTALGQNLEWHSKMLPQVRAYYASLPYVEEPERDPDPFDEFRDGMDALLGLADELGIPVVAVGQPVLWKPDMPEEEQAVLWFRVRTPAGEVRPSCAWLCAEMARYNAVQQGLAAAHGDAYVDPSIAIPADLRFFIDDCHLNDTGSRLLAETVLPAVAAEIEPLLAR